MIFIYVDQHLSTLKTFDKSDHSDAELKGFLNSIYNEFVDYWNYSRPDSPDDRIRFFLKQTNNNIGVEGIFEQLIALTEQAYRSRFYDTRIKLKLVSDPRVKYLVDAKIYYLKMDLDLTLADLKTESQDDVELSELIDENPDQSVFDRLQAI